MPDPTPSETDTQIENRTSAKVQGFITGLVKGIKSNWKDIALGVSLLTAFYINHLKESHNADEQRMLWHETHHIETVANIPTVETNQPPEVPAQPQK